jgi:hypothetical protein
MSDEHRIDLRSDADVTLDDKRITRAAKRTEWAHSALAGAADDLDDAHGEKGKPLTDLAEVLQHEATRIGNLADDIESHKSPPDRRTERDN